MDSFILGQVKDTGNLPRHEPWPVFGVCGHEEPEHCSVMKAPPGKGLCLASPILLSGCWPAYIVRRIMSPSGLKLSLHLCCSETAVKIPTAKFQGPDHGTGYRVRLIRRPRLASKPWDKGATSCSPAESGPSVLVTWPLRHFCWLRIKQIM